MKFAKNAGVKVVGVRGFAGEMESRKSNVFRITSFEKYFSSETESEYNLTRENLVLRSLSNAQIQSCVGSPYITTCQ